MSTEINTINYELNPAAVVRTAWEAYQTVLAKYLDELRRINAAFGDVFPDRYVVDVASRYKHVNLLIEAANKLQKTLIAKAEKEFGSLTIPLEIDEEAVNEAFPIEKPPFSSDDDDILVCVPFNPEGVWAWLEANYGGERGKKESLRQAAGKMCDAFNLHRHQPRFKSGYMILDLPIYIDDFNKKYSGKNKLNWRSNDDFQCALSALEYFAMAVNRSMLVAGVQSLRRDLDQHHLIRSREKFMVGDKGTELILITFLNRFEFQVRADTANDLQIFLGSHLDPMAA